MKIAFLLFLWLLGLAFIWHLTRRLGLQRRSRERIFEAGATNLPAPSRSEPSESFLSLWLLRAGYRSPRAVPTFLGLTLLGAGVGATVLIGFFASGILTQVTRQITSAPGAVFLPLVYFIPWFFFGLCGLVPTILVRRARRQRVSAIEQDLPITLELLATLNEAGLGFDASLQRVLQSQAAERPLQIELQTFHAELLAGRPRIECLRRLARRVDVSALTIFVSALVQAEQIGSGVVEVLRHQSNDLRDRRREQAIALASTLPVKLLFPLVICFLPAILVTALGPVFHQLFLYIDSLLQSRGH